MMASAQSTIDHGERFAYATNAGWLECRPSAAHGVRVTETCLSGFAYSGNTGWINFGNGTPVNGFAYANDSASDFGVNIAGDGSLIGYAYGANIGWISFEQSLGKAKLNFLTGQIDGSAFSANIGWIVFDTSQSKLTAESLACPDSDGDGIADSFERFYFSSLTTANASTDFDKDGVSDLDEYRAMTVPRDAKDWLRITEHTHARGPFAASTITFRSSPARLYRIEYNDDLSSLWTISSDGLFAPGSGTTTSKLISHENFSKVFFRVVASKPLQP